jgi:Clp amino terminal domain, pathogenicity island component
MTNSFESFSHRSQMIVFLTRMDSGRRGAKALEPGDLLEAIINEDQGELAKRFEGSFTESGPIRAPEPFFSAELASKVLPRLHNLLPQHEPVADSLDMPMSSGIQNIMEAATTLARELEHNQVQPLHLVAAILAEETSEPAEILKEAGVSRQAIIQALRS